MAQITKQDLFKICKQIAPNYKFDPLLILALCQQEAAKDEHNPDIFLGDVARLEQRFYNKYIMGMDYATTTEVLLACSYGITQMLGESLLEREYFKNDFWEQDVAYQVRYQDPMSEENVPKALNRYCVNFNAQIEYACKHLDFKRRQAGGDTGKMLDLWNGDLTGGYRVEVFKKYNILKGSGIDD